MLASAEDKPSRSLSREVAGVVVLALGLLLLAALASFHPQDPSLGQSEVLGRAVRNWIGRGGAYLAGGLMEVLGLAGFLAPLSLAWWGARLFDRRYQGLRLPSLMGLSLLIPATAGLLSLFWNKILWAGIAVQSGGWAGSLLSQTLASGLNKLGAGFVLICAVLVGTMLAADLSLAAVLEALRNQGGSFFSRLATARIRLREKKEKASSPQFQRLKETLDREPPKIDSYDAPAEETPARPRRPQPRQEKLPFPPQEGRLEPPPLSLLEGHGQGYSGPDPQSLEHNARLLEKKLFDFGVEGQVKEIHPGPVITMYEYEPAPGVKISRIANLADDLALALRSTAIRIVAPLPGKGCLGLELPNPKREIVSLKEILSDASFQQAKGGLPMALGKDIVGRPYVTDLTRMPHLLIAGATGSGKSVCLNSILISIFYRFTPDTVRLIMVDPKRIELSIYDGIPHLIHPVLTEPKAATKALRWAVTEMERRYELLARLGVRSIDAFNQKRAKDAGPPPPPTAQNGEVEPLPEHLPYLVIVIDELADLMMVASKDVEESITRLAQMARAAGIHLVLATQRPSVDVITGVIKANFPTRIAFQVASKVDSRTILDQNGAENLLGLGDMLFLPPGVGRLTRLHGAFVSDAEVKRVADFLRAQGRPEYDQTILTAGGPEGAEDILDEEEDERYQDAVRLVTATGKASISLVQRKLRVGYNRAARMIERMAAEGIVSEPDHANNRQVLVRTPEETDK